MTYWRVVPVSSRTERVRDLDVKIDTVRYQEFIGQKPYETILVSNKYHTIHITRNGEYPRIQWNGEACTSRGPLSHCYDPCGLIRELRALPPEAIS